MPNTNINISFNNLFFFPTNARVPCTDVHVLLSHLLATPFLLCYRYFNFSVSLESAVAVAEKCRTCSVIVFIENCWMEWMMSQKEFQYHFQLSIAAPLISSMSDCSLDYYYYYFFILFFLLTHEERDKSWMLCQCVGGGLFFFFNSYLLVLCLQFCRFIQLSL